MKVLKKCIATVVAIALTSSSWLFPGSMVSAVNESYRRGSITEDFETLTAEQLQAGASEIVKGFTNNGTVAVTDLVTNGKTLSLEPAAGFSDTSMLTKSGLFPYDVTVVEVFLRITDTLPTGRAACVNLRKSSDSSYNRLLLDFNGGTVRNGLDTSKTVSQVANRWYQVQFVFDQVNQTVSVSVLNVNLATVSASLTVDLEDAYLQFQALQTLQIDDITISDGFYLENDFSGGGAFYNESFDHLQSLNPNTDILGFSRASVTTQGVVENENNTYLSVTAATDNATFYTTGNDRIRLTTEQPGVIQFRLKVDAAQTFNAGLRTNSGTYVSLFIVTNGIVSFGRNTTTFDATDGEFHTYRIKFTPLDGGGYNSSLTVDNVWFASQIYGTTITAGARWDFRFPTSGAVALLDDFQICYLQAATVREISGNTSADVSVVPSEASFIFEANNPINYSTINASSFTLTAADQTVVPVVVAKTDSAANTFVLQPETSLSPETTYTLSFADQAAKDLYDQYFSGTLLTFTTAAVVKPTYTVTATSANDTMGSATVTTEGTAFEEGASVTVTATAAEGNKFTGWTAEGITLTEEQKTQNPLTITMPAGNVTLTAAFEAKTNATITPTTADYDKYSSAANHAAIDVTLTVGDYAFNALKNGETTLTADTDYTVNGNTYTITTTYLDTLATGATALTFDMDGGTDPTLTITVADSTPLPPNTYTVTATSADATKGTSAVTTEGTAFEEGASVTVTATAAEGNKFTGWTAEGITLTEEQKTQNPLTITMPAGNVTLTAAFEAKTNATITPTTADYDKYSSAANHAAIDVTLTAGDYAFNALKNGETTLSADTDYTVNGNTYTITTTYLDTLATGATALTFDMDGGTNPTLTITVTDTTPAPTYTVTATSANDTMGSATVTTEGAAFEEGASVAVTATANDGYKFTNWTAVGITLTEEQITQNPLTITMPAENVTLTAVFEEETKIEITPGQATYDKYTESTDHKDLVFTLTTGKAAVASVKLGDTELKETTDYTLNEGILTLLASTLDGLSGEVLLTVELEGGATLSATVSVTDTTPTEATYKVAVSAGTGGTARITTAKTEYLPGENVTVSATAASGYTFSHWSSNDVTLTTSGTTASFTMPEKDVTVFAYFTKNSTGTSGGRRTTNSSSTSIAGVVFIPDDEEIVEDDPYQAPVIDHVSSNYFNDTDTYSTWAYGYIEHLAAAGIVSGDQNGNYNPKNVVTREEFLKMLMGALGIEATTTTGSGYSDVNSGDWYAPYIYTGTELGLVNGMGDGTFGVGQLITRQDMAVMASRALAIVGKTLRQDQAVELTDLDTVAGYARSSVEQLAAAGVICGDENAAYRPADSALREDAAKIIYIIWKS